MKTSRRTFLRAAGITLALPSLEAFAESQSPRRLVTIANPFGMLPDGFFPKGEGKLKDLPYLLQPLAEHRDQFTIFSNLDHGVSGGHSACHSFLSGIRDVEAGQWPDRNFSLDQRAAEHAGSETRFPSLVMSAGKVASGEQELRLSWTRNGVNIPPLSTTRALFDALFKADDPKELAAREKSFKLHDSILDSVNAQAKQLEKRLGQPDREKLDEYFTSIREAERKLELSEKWIHEPKPEPGMPMPEDKTIQEALPAFLDLIVMALQTDSTRVATLGIPSTLRIGDLNLSGSYHGFSHHGQDETLKRGLTVIETFQMQEISRFLGRLKTVTDSNGRPLVDTTTVLFGSGLGNGSSHSNKNLPILVAGGSIKSHGTHVVAPTGKSRRIPLCNLFTTLLQQFGTEVETFNKATGTMNEVV
ncbi:MAG: DUF1552 domain-containing protein [Verrucomicrobiales bacterium]|nr:DUF1552 domain-containing protein [Verrucomicrobiales bacterium]